MLQINNSNPNFTIIKQPNCKNTFMTHAVSSLHQKQIVIFLVLKIKYVLSEHSNFDLKSYMPLAHPSKIHLPPLKFCFSPAVSLSVGWQSRLIAEFWSSCCNRWMWRIKYGVHRNTVQQIVISCLQQSGVTQWYHSEKRYNHRGM